MFGLKQLTPLLHNFFQQSPFLVCVLFTLMLLNGLTSGLGILLIIPLISAAGIQLEAQGNLSINNNANSSADIGSRIADLFVQLGMNPSLNTVLLIYLLLISALALLNYSSALLGAKLHMQFVHRLRSRVLQAVFYVRPDRLSNERTSDFARLVIGQVQSLGSAIQQLLSLTSRLLLSLIYLGMSILLSPAMTFLALLSGLFLIIIQLPINKKIHQSGHIELSSYSSIFHSVFEQLSNLKIIKSHSAEKHYLQRMQDASEALENEHIRLARFNALSKLINLMGAALIFVALFYISIDHLGLPLANLILMLFIFSRLMPQLSNMQSSVQRLLHSAPEYTELIRRVDQLDEFQEPRTEATADGIQFNKTLTLKQLDYQYQGKAAPAFSKLDAQIQKNQTVAICGASGAGKSTLVDIVSGLVEQTNGQLLIDGQEINQTNRTQWRSKVAYIPQDVFLFNDSVRANLDWVRKTPVSDEQIWQCLKLAAAEEFVRALPQGLNSKIGDHGAKLSGGEKQRLALARALLSEPELLILDEATNALDQESEKSIQRALNELAGQLTIIVIAHDPASIKHADQRIDL